MKSVIIGIREADLADAEEEMFEVKRRGPLNSSAPKNSTQPAVVDKPYAMKTVQFYQKWSKVIPKKYDGEMCKKPTNDHLTKFQTEKKTKENLKKLAKAKQRKWMILSSKHWYHHPNQTSQVKVWMTLTLRMRERILT
jgi:hypothetical protein